jgi:predicted TIM-barrel fold metal-dependent hydrolase
VPYFFDRMDEHVEKRGRLTPACKREPREYLQRGQLYVSCEPEESTIPHAVEALGPYFILYASDYPHWDSDFPDSTRPLRERKDLSEVVKRRIMGDNARVFYGLGS